MDYELVPEGEHFSANITNVGGDGREGRRGGAAGHALSRFTYRFYYSAVLQNSCTAGEAI